MKAKQAGKESTVKVHWVPIEEVLPNPNNPRKISEEKVRELMESLDELPEMIEYRFLVVDRYTGYLLGGNQRWTAMRRKGMKEVPVAYSDEMTEEQKKEFIIRDNVEAGFWDNEKLNFAFKDFPLVSWGIMEAEPAGAKQREEDRSGVKDAKVVFDNAEVKQIVTYYDAATYAEISEKLEKIKDENYFGDNAEVLLFLIKNYGEHEAD